MSMNVFFFAHKNATDIVGISQDASSKQQFFCMTGRVEIFYEESCETFLQLTYLEIVKSYLFIGFLLCLEIAWNIQSSLVYFEAINILPMGLFMCSLVWKTLCQCKPYF